jgi:hypothetical protein
MLIPPGGKVVSANGTNLITIVEALPTDDGKDSLENAIIAL